MNLKNGGNQPGREKRKSSMHREYILQRTLNREHLVHSEDQKKPV